jgi:hypothetical protein
VLTCPYMVVKDLCSGYDINGETPIGYFVIIFFW